MRIANPPLNLRRRLRLRTGLLSLLALAACGEGGNLECGGPFCIVPPDRPHATRLRPGPGDAQVGAPGRELDAPLVVRVTDDDDRPVQDVVVTFAIIAGGGTLTETSVRSDIQGLAEVRWILGPSPGPQSVRVTAADEEGNPLDGSPLTFSAQGVRPPPARLVFVQAPSSSAQNGSALPQQPIIGVFDEHDGPVSDVRVTVAVLAGGGSLQGTTEVSTDGAGRATYTDLAILGTVGSHALGFSVSDPPLETLSATVQVQAGAAAQIVGNEPLVYQATVNSPVAPPPSVVVRDNAGNPVAGAVVVFATDGDASVSPTTATTDEQGLAQVTSWTLGTSAGRYTLSARVESSSLEPVVFQADASPGAAGRLEIVVQPAVTAQSGVPFSRQPVVRLVDQLGNPVPQRDLTVTATVFSGPSATLTNASATTNTQGRATFSGLTLTGLVGDYTISFSAPTVGGVTSGRIALSAGSALGLTLARQPSPSARSRVPFAVQPAIQLRDARGNPVAQGGVAIVASIAGGEGSLGGGTTAVTDGSGRAAYTDLTIIGPPGPRTLRFATGSPAAEVVSGQITLPSVATVSVLTSPPTSVVVGATLSAPVTWALADASGLPVPDVTVAISASAGNTVDPLSAVSDGSGAVHLQSWTVSQTAGQQSVELAAPQAPASRVTVQAVPGTAARIQKVSGDGQSAPVNSQLPAPLVVRVVDGFGNGVSGVVVQWRTCEGIGQYDALTDADGFASAFQGTGPQAGTFCIMASNGTLADSPVQFSYTATGGDGSVRVSPASVPPPHGREP